MGTQKERLGSQPEAALGEVMTPEAYIEARSHVFRCMAAWEWWKRKHREELFKRGALLEIGGRNLVVAGPHDRAVLELGAVGRKSQRASSVDEEGR